MDIKEVISTPKAPKALGPYSQALRYNDFLYISGQIPIDPISDKIPLTINEQTNQILINLDNLLTESQSSLAKVLKVTIFLTDLDNLTEVNEVYKDYFYKQPPARTTIEVSRLPKDVLIMIDVLVA